MATSPKVPRGILKWAKDIWRKNNPGEFYGGFYKAMDPWNHFEQQIGLVTSKAISSHLIWAYDLSQNSSLLQTLIKTKIEINQNKHKTPGHSHTGTLTHDQTVD